MMRTDLRKSFCFIFMAFWLGFSCISGIGRSPQGAAQNPPVLSVPETITPIKVDGHLGEDAWRKALVVELRYEIDPGENIEAKVATQVLLTYDEGHFYIGVRAFDPEPEKIRAHYTDRDKAFEDDWVLVSLDPFRDQRRSFEFLVNPLGVQMDTLLTEIGHGGSEVDPTWDAIWDSAGRILADGYSVEIAIPWSSLRFPRLQGTQKWGFQAVRHFPRNFSYYFRAVPWNRNRDCVLCENLIISGFDSASPGKNIELNPTATVLRTDESPSFPSGSVERGKPEPELGLSARWGMTPNINLNAALNPDFSQVEADVAQLAVNTRYALFYPEKRPFFLESMDLFRSPLSVIYTRTLASPVWGIKLTGKEQRDSFGLLAGEDSLTNIVLPSNLGSEFAQLGQNALSTVLRYRRDIGARSSLGALVTDRRGRGYRNSVYGIDGHFQLAPTDRVVFQLLGSRTDYPDLLAAEEGEPRGAFQGLAGSAFYGHEARNWHWWLKAESLGRGFRADVGFVPRVDTRTAEAGLRRVFWPNKETWFSRMNVSLEGLYTEDQSGRLTDRSVKVVGEIQGPLRSALRVGFVATKELFKNIFFDQKFLEFGLSVHPQRDLSLMLLGKWGEAIDYAGLRPARVVRANPGLVFFLNRHLQIQLDQLWERLAVAGGRLYLASLSQAHFVYQFSTRAFLRAVLQYQDVHENRTLQGSAENFLNPHLFTQFLFSYKVNPQTLLFLGYSDNRYGWLGANITPKDRTFFFKVSYAWVK